MFLACHFFGYYLGRNLTRTWAKSHETNDNGRENSLWPVTNTHKQMKNTSIQNRNSFYSFLGRCCLPVCLLTTFCRLVGRLSSPASSLSSPSSAPSPNSYPAPSPHSSPPTFPFLLSLLLLFPLPLLFLLLLFREWPRRDRWPMLSHMWEIFSFFFFYFSFFHCWILLLLSLLLL